MRELHCKLAKWLCKNYDVVNLPVFNTSQMARRYRRKLSKQTVRDMYSWSHYSFRQHLLHKAREMQCTVVLCTEEYTSRTCGQCGTVHDNLGGNPKFNCPACHARAGRDANGARNILLKVASEHEARGAAGNGGAPRPQAGRKRSRSGGQAGQSNTQQTSAGQRSAGM